MTPTERTTYELKTAYERLRKQDEVIYKLQIQIIRLEKTLAYCVVMIFISIAVGFYLAYQGS